MNIFCLRGYSRKHLRNSLSHVRYHTHGAAVIGKIEGLERKELSTRELMLKIRPYIWPTGQSPEEKLIKQKVKLTGSCIFTAKALSLCVPVVYRDLVNVISDISSSGVITLEQGAAVMGPAFAVYAALYLLEPMVDQYKSYTFATVKQRTTRVIGKGLIEKLFSLDHQFHSNRETGALLKAVDRGNRAIATVLHASCIVFVPAVFQVLCTGLSIWYFCGPAYAASLLLTAAVYSSFSIKFTGYRTPFRIAMNKADMEAGNLATDSLLNYETVKYFGNEKFEAIRYDEKLAKYETAALKTDRTLAVLNIGQQLILGGCLVGNLWLATHGISAGVLTIGDFVMISAYFHAIQRPLSFLGSTYRDLTQAKTDFETMWKLMDEKVEMDQGPTSLPSDIETAIRFSDVNFGYNKQQVLKGVSFDILPGERVAVVGGSGSGKSTLAKLLFRFYDPNEGSISINGHDIRDCQLNSVRGLIGVVPQDCVLFNDTIFNNIRYGRLDATAEEIYEAARIADLHNSVIGMKDGYDTIVGERGAKLSGGEKQRLAIARCFVKNPSIVIYDEATSSLDSLTEQRILQSLDEATRNKSLLVIAHRLSTIVNSDKIVVLKEGRAIEVGTHDELIALNGEYKLMWDIQSSDKSNDNTKVGLDNVVESKRQRLTFASLMEAKTCCGGKC